MVWNLDGNSKNTGIQGGDVQNHGGNLGIAVEMKQESNGNDKFKEWREVKIIVTEHICINLILQNLFLVSLWTYFAQWFSAFIIEFGQVNTVWKGQVEWKIYVFFIFNLLVPLFRPSLFIVVLFSIFHLTEVATGGAL